MATYKTIHDLTALGAAPAADDELEVWDTSASTSKRATVSELASAVTSTGSLATDAEVTAAISAHSGAADPHGDRAFTTSAISALSSVYQPLDSDLTAIAALTTTSYGRAFLALADAAAGRTALGLGTAATTASTAYDPAGSAAAAQAASQPLDSDLTAIAALLTTSFGRGLLALADAAAARSSLGVAIGTNVQAWAADLDAIAALSPAADRLPYFTGATTAALATFTAAGRALVDDADAEAQRTTLGAAAATDLTTHTALTTGVHGVTRQLVTYTAATPALIAGNLYTLATQNSTSAGQFAGSNLTLAVAASAGADGSGEMVGTVVTSGLSTSLRVASTAGVRATVSAGVAYTISHRFRASRVSVAYRVLVDWFDSAGAFISQSSGTAVTPTVSTAYYTATCTATSPALAAFARSMVGFVTNADAVAGDILSISVACIRTSATIPGSSGVTELSAANGACLRVSGSTAIATSAASGDGVSYTTADAGDWLRTSVGAVASASTTATDTIDTNVVQTATVGTSRFPLRTECYPTTGIVTRTITTTLANGGTLTLDPIMTEWIDL